MKYTYSKSHIYKNILHWNCFSNNYFSPSNFFGILIKERKTLWLDKQATLSQLQLKCQRKYITLNGEVFEYCVGLRVKKKVENQ